LPMAGVRRVLLGDPFDTPATTQAAVADFGPGRPNRVEVHHGGRMVVIAEAGDSSFSVPRLIAPQLGAVDVVIHGKPGRFGTSPEANVEVPPAVVAQLLEDHGIARGAPLRCVTCHGGEAPAVGPPATQRLATEWNGPVQGANGLVVVRTNNIRVDVGDWSPEPIFGGQQFDVYPPATPGYPNGGQGQGTFLPFTP
jgi:hypothetical protein